MRSAVVNIGLIRVTDRIRTLSEKTVDVLVDSIAEVGLLNPITVYAKTIVHNGQPVPGFGLVAGAHRFEACRRLGLAEIAVTITDLADQARIIAECDENLCGAKLSAGELAAFTAKRKEAYLFLHPETGHGGDRKSSGELRHLSDAPSFIDDTAAKTGKSARTVRENAERGSKICSEALAMIKGTHLDKGNYLDAIKGLSPKEQVERVRRNLIKSPKVIPSPDDDEEAETRQVAALMSAWNKAGAEARDTFLAQIGAAR